tara:strand:- start:3 stop:320 length:318 start_codon:yes stop_codon:yes gene_type:complete
MIIEATVAATTLVLLYGAKEVAMLGGAVEYVKQDAKKQVAEQVGMDSDEAENLVTVPLGPPDKAAVYAVTFEELGKIAYETKGGRDKGKTEEWINKLEGMNRRVA